MKRIKEIKHQIEKLIRHYAILRARAKRNAFMSKNAKCQGC